MNVHGLRTTSPRSDFEGKGRADEIHDHFFPAANTGLATLINEPEVAEIHEAYLKDKKMRIDLFALREGGGIDAPMLGPLRPEVPTLSNLASLISSRRGRSGRSASAIRSARGPSIRTRSGSS